MGELVNSSTITHSTVTESTSQEAKIRNLILRLKSLDLSRLEKLNLKVDIRRLEQLLESIEDTEIIQKNKQLMGFMIEGESETPRGITIPRLIFKDKSGVNVAQQVYKMIAQKILDQAQDFGIVDNDKLKVVGSVADGTCTFPCEVEVLPELEPLSNSPLQSIHDIDLEVTWKSSHWDSKQGFAHYDTLQNYIDELVEALPPEIRPSEIHFDKVPQSYDFKGQQVTSIL